MHQAHPLPASVSEIFDPRRWRTIEGFTHTRHDDGGDDQHGAAALTDVTYHRACERDDRGAWLRDLPVVRVAIDRPHLRNAFRPHTVDELHRTLDHARMSGDVGAVVLTGNGPSPKDGGWGFCSGGDQRVRDRDGYRYEAEDAQARSGSVAGDHDAEVAARRARIDSARAGRLHILEVQRLIRTMPKVVIAAVSGWAAGGGHSLNVVADLSLASRHLRRDPRRRDRGAAHR